MRTEEELVRLIGRAMEIFDWLGDAGDWINEEGDVADTDGIMFTTVMPAVHDWRIDVRNCFKYWGK